MKFEGTLPTHIRMHCYESRNVVVVGACGVDNAGWQRFAQVWLVVVLLLKCGLRIHCNSWCPASQCSGLEVAMGESKASRMHPIEEGLSTTDMFLMNKWCRFRPLYPVPPYA